MQESVCIFTRSLGDSDTAHAKGLSVRESQVLALSTREAQDMLCT